MSNNQKLLIDLKRFNDYSKQFISNEVVVNVEELDDLWNDIKHYLTTMNELPDSKKISLMKHERLCKSILDYIRGVPNCIQYFSINVDTGFENVFNERVFKILFPGHNFDEYIAKGGEFLITNFGFTS